ncbi:MAG: hypothetical protein LBQ81_12740 [Zoogloeaceae bacterium]|jgi:hypothetical protein|nr:hypothetical protein [Zoogloeaceae bacterium]
MATANHITSKTPRPYITDEEFEAALYGTDEDACQVRDVARRAALTKALGGVPFDTLPESARATAQRVARMTESTFYDEDAYERNEEDVLFLGRVLDCMERAAKDSDVARVHYQKAMLDLGFA